MKSVIVGNAIVNVVDIQKTAGRPSLTARVLVSSIMEDPA
jgi:hypothetical protein